MWTRRNIIEASLLSAGARALPSWALASKKRYEPVDLGKGKLTQSWFLESFLELKDDIEEAKNEGKRLAILWEQDGCPYCREMHNLNFAIPEIREYVEKNFAIIQMDIWGSREVTDFAQKTVKERDLAKQWKVRFTPTIQFITDDAKAAGGNTPKAFEVARMPGYLRPIHFLWMFEYVQQRAYDKGDFRGFVKQKVAWHKKNNKPFPDWK